MIKELFKVLIVVILLVILIPLVMLLFGEGALTSAFVPIFKEQVEAGRLEEARRLAREDCGVKERHGDFAAEMGRGDVASVTRVAWRNRCIGAALGA